jgi:alkylated DNA repair dioxygenase AlkB
MLDFFPNEKIILDLPDAIFEYYPNFLNELKATEIFQNLLNETPWQLDKITVFGKTYLQPRLTALYGNEGKPYSYSKIIMQPNKWSPILSHLKTEIEEVANHTFTTTLINLYRNEKDSNGWHADNEKELGRNPIIASLSLGEERVFQLKHNTKKECKKSVLLQHGSLLIMRENCQIYYKHQIPKATKPKKERINLTFRQIL